MSKWDQYRINSQQINNQNNSSKWDQYRINSQQTETQNFTKGNRIASIGKAVAAGAIGAIPDTASLLYNLPVMGINMIREKPFPLIPSATEAIDKKIDTITGGYTTTPENQKYLNEGIKFASSFATGGGLAKTANKTLSTIGNWAGNTKLAHITGAGAAGATGSYLADQGASTGETLGGAVGANLLVSNLPTIASATGPAITKLASMPTKLLIAAAGLGKNKINLPVAQAAKELDIPVPNFALTENNRLLKAADSFLGSAPVMGKDNIARQSLIGEKILKNLNNAYNSIIDSTELIAADQRIKALYNNAEEAVQNIRMPTTKTSSVVKEIQSSINTASPSTDEKHVLEILKNLNQFFNIEKSPTVSSLVSTKRSLNDIIKWDIKNPGAKSLLKKVQSTIQDDLADYGKTNPEWYKFYTEADSLYSKVTKREKLVDLLATKAESSATGEITFNNLSKILNDPKSKEKISRLVNSTTMSKLEKLGTVTQALAKNNKNIINPNIGNTKILIAGLAGVGGVAAGGPALLAAVPPIIVARMITSEKLLNKAIEFAQKNTVDNAIKFNKEMKAVTGYTPTTLFQQISQEPNQVTRSLARNLQTTQQNAQKKDTKTQYYNVNDFENYLNSDFAKKMQKILNADVLNPSGD